MPDWQTIVVIGCVAWAVYCLARRGVRLVHAGKSKGKAACGSCGGCGSEASGSANRSAFVSLDTLRQPKK